jgi:hypothetical protein
MVITVEESTITRFNLALQGVLQRRKILHPLAEGHPSCSRLTGPCPAVQTSVRVGQTRDQSVDFSRHLGNVGLTLVHSAAGARNVLERSLQQPELNIRHWLILEGL